MATRTAHAPSWEAITGIVATAVTTALFALYAVATAQSATQRTPLVWFLGLLTFTGPTIGLVAYLRATREGNRSPVRAVGHVLLIWACPALVMTIVLGVATLIN